MEVYVRKRSSRPPFEVIAALVAGIVIGFGASYFLFAGAPTPPPPDETPVAALPSGTPEPAPPSEEPQPPAQEPGPPQEEPPTAPAPGPAVDLAKIEEVWPGRHLFIAVQGKKLDSATKEMLGQVKPGGVVIRSENFKERTQLVDLIAEIKAAVGLGTTIDALPLIAVAQEGGPLNVLNLKEAPTAAKLGAANNLDAAKAAGVALGQSLVDRGIAVLLAPVLDVYGKTAPKEVQARCFGDHHQNVAAIGLAYTDGAVSAGVLPVVKHFPGMGTIKGDTVKTLATLADDSERLSQLLFPFSEAARCNVPGILVGHVVVPSVDSDTKPLPAASMSPTFIKGLLRDKWSYPGVVLADDVNKGAITKSMPVEQAAVAALAAGNDAVLMLNADVEKIRLVCASIEKATVDGVLDRAALSESKKRLDGWVQALKTPRAGLDGPLPPLPGADKPVDQPGAAPAAETQPAAATETSAPAAAETEYTVASGDSISKVANKFKVTVDEVRSWNGLKSDNLYVGQKLLIKAPTPADSQPTPPAPAPETAAPTPAPAAASAPETPTPAPAGPGAVEPPSEEPSVQPPANTKAIEYVVKGGDFLSSIATRHKVTHQEIMTWNHLNNVKLSVGQKLTIYVSPDFVSADAPAPADAPKADAPPAAETPKPADAPATADAAPASGEEIVYTVKKGDNLANVGAKYGVTADDIRGWNGIEGNRLDVGQQLKIRPKKKPAE